VTDEGGGAHGARERLTIMTSPADRKYTKTHEWVSLDGDVATIGVTDFAQSELGDITYLELPEVGDAIALNQAFGIVESVKAANDIFSPVDGEVLERNEAAMAAPETINQSPYGEAWLVKVRVGDPAQLDALMAADEYDKFAQASAH
jgi:glycine cleavage system H protein